MDFGLVMALLYLTVPLEYTDEGRSYDMVIRKDLTVTEEDEYYGAASGMMVQNRLEYSRKRSEYE